MATARISTPAGIAVELEGTPEEISAVVERLKNETHAIRVSQQWKKGEIAHLIDSLRTEEFFTSPRGLGEIQKKLAELGHHYPVTTLSGPMQAQARTRNLRRFKKNGKYVYVG
jgi:superfamily II DNA/RNA helicase